jgi:D-beta-D-heptose 7-phosphate kinase/D-beta-D-heptose 1-phosphate adenosyltransferase
MTDCPLKGLVSLLRGRAILVLGDIMLDEYIWGDVRRISPEAPVPVVELRSRSDCPGGAANVSANVVSLGGAAVLGGVVGNDEPAERLIAELHRRGVVTCGILSDPNRPTTTKTRIVARSQQVLRLDSEKQRALSCALEDALLEWAHDQLPITDACILSDYAKGVVSPRLAQGLINQAREAGKPLIVDPKGPDFTRYRGATVITPNLAEAERFVNRETCDRESVLELGHELSARLGDTALLMTLGSEGMLLFEAGSEPRRFLPESREVLDVTGAGDTVVTTLALGLASGGTLQQSARLATFAAGIAVGKFGTAVVRWEELMAAVSKRDARLAVDVDHRAGIM